MQIENRTVDMSRDLPYGGEADVVSNRLRSDTSRPSGSASTGSAPRNPVPSDNESTSRQIPSVKGVDLKVTVEKLNKIISDQQKDVAFSVDKEANTTVIKVFRKNTGELIKQYPPEEILAMKAKLRKGVGWLIDKNA
jgi:flagellar protein FlaG